MKKNLLSHSFPKLLFFLCFHKETYEPYVTNECIVFYQVLLKYTYISKQ